MLSFLPPPVESQILDPCIHAHLASDARGVEPGDTRGEKTGADVNAGAYGTGTASEDPGGFGTGCRYFLGQRFA